MKVTKQDVQTALWLAEYVGLNGNGFTRDEEKNTASMAVNLADTYCLSIDAVTVRDDRQVWLDALSMLEKACSIRFKVESAA